MDEASEAYLKTATEDGWARVVELLALITGLCRTVTTPLSHRHDTLPRGVRCEAFRLLRIAESLARRLIAVIALQMDPAGPPPPKRPGTRFRNIPRSPEQGPCVPQGGGAGSIERVPAFQLFEAMPRAGKVVTVQHAVIEPAPSVPVERKRLSPAEPVMAGDLVRRIAALEGVIAHPRRAARRLNRWLARRTKGPKLRLHNMRPGWPPGMSRRCLVDASRASELGGFVRRFAFARAGPPG